MFGYHSKGLRRVKSSCLVKVLQTHFQPCNKNQNKIKTIDECLMKYPTQYGLYLVLVLITGLEVGYSTLTT